MHRHGIIVQPYDHIAATFNPTIIKHDDRFRLLVRAVPAGYEKIGPINEFDDNYTSHLSLWEGLTPTEFVLVNENAVAPSDDLAEAFDAYGAEDPRVTKIGKTYYICYTSLAVGLGQPHSGDGVRIAMASTTDFKTFKKHGVIGPDIRCKAGALFESSGQLYFLWKDEHVVERTMLSPAPADFENPDAWSTFWHDHTVKHYQLLGPQNNAYEGRGVEPGAPPIDIEEGLLLIYSSISMDFKWTISALVLDKTNPARIVSKTEKPILIPQEDYELRGDVNNVVFPCGALIDQDLLYVYYGAADSLCAVASMHMNNLRTFLKPYHGEQPVEQQLPFHQANDGAFLELKSEGPLEMPVPAPQSA
jgi:predicted GH43/DUF377 family glycosyl hydrolase